MKGGSSKPMKLAKEGYRYLEEGDAEAALKIAAKLEEIRFTAAFEIAARAHAQLDDLSSAVAVLERGLDLAPTVWLNWQLLGNYRSDLERYDEAGSAYGKAMECPGVWESSVRLNQAVLASRRGMIEEALAYLEGVKDEKLHLRAASVRVDTLRRGGRLDEAIRVGETALNDIESDEADQYASLAASIVRARVDQGATPDEIFDFALEALDEYDPGNSEILSLIRHVDKQYSTAAKYHRLLVHGRLTSTAPEHQEFSGYYVSYDVVADSLAEALAFVERMESPWAGENLTLTAEEHEVVEARPDARKGVYARTGRHCYGSEDEDPPNDS